MPEIYRKIYGNEYKQVGLTVLFVSLLMLCLQALSPLAVAENLHSGWSELLARHVKDGVVDYGGFKKDEASLDAYLELLGATDPAALQRNESLALYINAYNAYTVKLILDNFREGKPVTSIKKLGGFFSGPWKIKFCKIGGKLYTLDNIEHDIIRKEYGDPRIHFAVNCASKSCPPLIAEPYEAEKLEAQLELNAQKFINNKGFTYVKGEKLYLSKIFSWFTEDFDDDAVLFVRRYASDSLRKEIDTLGSSIKVEYLDYDWSLNGK